MSRAVKKRGGALELLIRSHLTSNCVSDMGTFELPFPEGEAVTKINCCSDSNFCPYVVAGCILFSKCTFSFIFCIILSVGFLASTIFFTC